MDQTRETLANRDGPCLITESLRPGSWVECYVGGPRWFVWTSAARVGAGRPIRAIYRTAQERPAADAIAAAIRRLGYNRVTVCKPEEVDFS